MPGENDPIVDACEAEWEEWKGDCSGFVKAVAQRLGVPLSGNANNMIDYLEHAESWTNLGADRALSTNYARRGYFVIGGRKHAGHGHVVVVVKSNPQPYPIAYWGSLGFVGRKRASITYSWAKPLLPQVHFFARML